MMAASAIELELERVALPMRERLVPETACSEMHTLDGFTERALA